MNEDIEQNNLKEEPITFEVDKYDLAGLIKLCDSAEAVFILTFEDIDESRHYMNRYQNLELYLSADEKVRSIYNYLEQDEEQGVFISFAFSDKGKMRILGMSPNKQGTDCGELELGDNMIYGVLVSIKDEEYIFDEVVYFDGDNKNHSWAEKVLDAGELTYLLQDLIDEFRE